MSVLYDTGRHTAQEELLDRTGVRRQLEASSQDLRLLQWFVHLCGWADHAPLRGRRTIRVAYFTTTEPVWACVFVPEMCTEYSYVPGLSNFTRPSLPR